MRTYISALRARWADAGARHAFAWEIGPFVVLVLVIWAKLSYFNFPPAEVAANDWNRWRLKEATQAGLASLGTLLLLLAPTLRLRTRPRLAVLWIVNFAASLLVFADVLHFRFYGDVLSVAAVGNAAQVGMVQKSIMKLVRLRDLLLFADFVAGLALLPLFRGARGDAPARNRTWLRPQLRALSIRAALLGVLLVGAFPARVVALDRGDTFRNTHFRFFGVRKIGLLNFHLYEGGKQGVRRLLIGREVGPEDRARVRAKLAEQAPLAAAITPLTGIARGKNLILVMVESLQEFPLELRIAGKEVTPNLNALAARSMVWENFYDQTWDGTTSDGEFASLQSLHPLPAGAVPTTYPTNQYRGLPKVLRERGYATLSAHAYFGDLWNMRGMHARLGFEQSWFRETYRLVEEFGMGLSDGEFFRQTLPRLRQLPRPFGAYLMTLSTHHPYELPDRYKTLPLGEMQGTLIGDYLQTVHYLDSVLGEFVRELDASGLLNSSVLVIYGDHKAPDLGPVADLEHLLTRYAGYPARSRGFDPRYWSAANRLPLLVHLPDDAAAGVRHGSVGHLDIAPTVLNLLGMADHKMVSLGRAATQGEAAFVVQRDGSFVIADTVCVVPGAGNAKRRCGVISTGQPLDPARFEPHFTDARTRLEVSDLILSGDLLRKL